MKRALPAILDALQSLALALWLGGLALFWLTLVPTVERGAESAALLLRVWNGLGLWFERSGLVIIGVQFVLRRRYQGDRTKFIADGVRQLLTFAALMLAEYGLRGSPGASPFAASAGVLTLKWVSVVEAVLLIGVVALTAWLQSGTKDEPQIKADRRGPRK